MSNSDKSLNHAKNAKKDEFYTQMQDIENELQYYTQHFKGKTVYCNCDNPKYSNFYKYFKQNFDVLGLRKLICSHIGENASATEYENGIETKRALDSGDFRSPECIELLEEADIVVTNPPFSLFREFIAQLMKYNKKFLVIGNQNAITYKNLFSLLKDNKMHLGISIRSGDREFQVPDSYPLQASGCRIDEYGNKYIKVKGVRWFTNLDTTQKCKPLVLTKTYNPTDYPKYDNCDVIEVKPTKHIPMDYTGLMGVPISFMDKYCPNQFEIVGLDRYVECNPRHCHRFTINGKELFARIVIRRKLT